MKDYIDFMQDAWQWQQNRPRFLIDELLPDNPGDFGIIAGRTGRGKTAILLYLLCCLATGTPFFGIPVQKIPVGYLGFEGNKVNITERLQKMLPHFPTPDPGYLNLEISDQRYTLKGNVHKLAIATSGLRLLIIDRAKGLVGGDYVKPNAANRFVEDLHKALKDFDIPAIISLQIKKPHDETKVKPGDLFSIKGAMDYVEDATFVALLEQPSMKHPPKEYSNLYFAKHREARTELNDVELEYDYSKAMFVPR